MYIDPTERMKKIHIWIGSTSKTEDAYYKYFDQDEQKPQFCQDLGIEEYDEDFAGFIPPFDNEITISEILKEAPIHKLEIEMIIKKCEDMNIFKANTIFYLTDSSVEILKPYKTEYNGAKYIGIFNSING